MALRIRVLSQAALAGSTTALGMRLAEAADQLDGLARLGVEGHQAEVGGDLGDPARRGLVAGEDLGDPEQNPGSPRSCCSVCRDSSFGSTRTTLITSLMCQLPVR